MKRLITVVGIAVLAFAAVGSAGAQSDPRIGTWKLNLEKSIYSPGPPPRSETRTYKAQGSDIVASAESVDAEGNPISVRYTANADGKDYPMTGSVTTDAITIRRIDANTFEADGKKGGKVRGTTRMTISKDRKVLTLTTKGTNARVQAINNVAVFDKQ